MALSEVLKTALETECEAESKLNKSADDSVRVALRAVTAFDLDDESKATIAKALGFEVEKKPDEDKRSKLEKAAETDPAVKAELEEIRKAQADAEAKRVELEKKLEDSKRETLRKELVAKAEKDFAAVPGTADEKADMLIGLRSGNPDAISKVEESLKAMSAQIEKSELLKSKGHNGDASDVKEQVAAKVAELRKSQPELTEIQARVAVLKADRDLKARYREEVR